MTKSTKPIVQNLAELLALVESGLDFSERQRRDIVSDLRALARLTGQPLETLPAETSRLRAVFAGVHPAQARVSKKRLQNIHSNVAAALRQVRCPAYSALSRVPLNAHWQRLYDILQDKPLRYALSGFMRYCSMQRVVPHLVTDSEAADYHRYLAEVSLKQKPNAVYQATCRAWNRASASVSGWPSVELTLPSFRRETDTIPLDRFPPKFVLELEDYLSWLAGKHLLDDRQPPAICQPSTLQLRRTQLQQLASAAVHGGYDIGRIQSLAVLVSRPVVECSIRYYLDKPDPVSSTYIRDLVKTLKRLAQHWITIDEDELLWLRKLVRRLDTQAPGLTEKNRSTLRQFDSPANLQRLFDLPDILMRKAKQIQDPYRAAHLYLWGLVIELLTFAPMRIHNLASLEVNRHLVRPEGPRGPIILCLNENETKTRAPHEYPLPVATCRKLDHYLKHHRLHLLNGSDNPWLWPNRKGSHKSTITMSERIRKLIYRETGLNITPHQFRHLAAKLILQARPGEFELARQVLGHRHVSTTINFYAGMQSREAVAIYDDIVTQRRGPRKKTRP